MARSSCGFYGSLCILAAVAVLVDLQYGSSWAAKRAAAPEQPYTTPVRRFTACELS
jgi:hypothetical protein